MITIVADDSLILAMRNLGRTFLLFLTLLVALDELIGGGGWRWAALPLSHGSEFRQPAAEEPAKRPNVIAASNIRFESGV
jgi:hypothetical protein